MNELVKMIKPENIIFLSKDASHTKEAVLDSISTLLFKNGYVKGSYVEAVKEREAVFPTGLNTLSYGIAIPHVDSKHVEKATIAVGILKNAVNFQEMGAENTTVPVRLLFMLAIKDPTKQLDILQEVIALIESGEKITALVQATNKADVLRQLNE